MRGGDASSSTDAWRLVERLVGVWAVWALGACVTWRPVRGDGAAEALRATTRPEVRLHVTGWRGPVLVHAPRTVGDSLVGTRITTLGEREGPRLAVPLTAIARVEEPRGGPSRTAVVTWVVIFGAAIALAARSLSSI